MPLNRDTLLAELRILVVTACGKAVDPASLTEDESLFGPEARLALDSLDALQVSMALQKAYGVRLADSKETRRILSSLGNLATFLEGRQP